jgi:hypothetical protein
MLIYDAEIKNCIPTKKSLIEYPNLQHCAGWKDFANMGLACLCWADTATGLTGVVMDDNIDQFMATAKDLIEGGAARGGFNQVNFDDNLLAVNGIVFPPGENFDLLRAIWSAAGLDPNSYGYHHNGYGLAAVAEANGLPGKIGEGALAPVLWQQGKIGQVVNYCHHDVWLTATLISIAKERGGLVCPKKGGMLKISVPDDEVTV